MFRTSPTWSFAHVARAFAKESGSRCLKAMNVSQPARSFLVAALSRRLGRPILALSPSDAEAEEMFREISSYLGPEGACLLPPGGAPQNKNLPPYPPAVHDRMRALFRLFRARGGAAQGMVPVVVCPVSAALETTLPPAVFAASVFRGG